MNLRLDDIFGEFQGQSLFLYPSIACGGCPEQWRIMHLQSIPAATTSCRTVNRLMRGEKLQLQAQVPE